MRPTATQERVASISFADLESRVQTYLWHRAPDPDAFTADDVEDFRREFLYQFPELRKEVSDSRIMRRLMKSGVTERQKRQTAKPRRLTAAIA